MKLATHRPIQLHPFGILLVVDRTLERMVGISNHASGWFLGDSNAPSETSTLAWMPSEMLHDIRNMLGTPTIHTSRQYLGCYPHQNKFFDVYLYASQDHVILEWEPLEKESIVSQKDLQQLESMMRDLSLVRNESELVEAVVQSLIWNTEFEHIVVQKFLPDGSSVVLQEECPVYQTSFQERQELLHFTPEEREHIFRISLLCVPDWSQQPVTLQSYDNDTVQPDLSYATLRYFPTERQTKLRKIGIQASMDLALVFRQQLWGIVSCYSELAPYTPAPTLRSNYMMFQHVVSLLLSHIHRDVHDAGDLVIVQTEDSAKFDEMPLEAQETGVADLALPPQSIAPALLKYTKEALTPAQLKEFEHTKTLELELPCSREDLQATIEELKAANEELRASNEELQRTNGESFRHMSEFAAEVHVLFDAQGNLVYSNKAFQKMLKFKDSDIENLSITEILAPIHPQKFQAQFAEAMGGQAQIFESKAYTKRGDLIPIEIALSGFTSNQESYLFASLKDITRRLEQEEELKKRLNQYQIALEAGEMGSWEWYPETDRVEWTDNLYELFGVSPGEVDLNGESLKQPILPEDRAEVEEVLADALANKTSYTVSFRIQVGEEIRYIQSKGRIERNEAGEVHRVIGICWNNTKEQRSRERLTMQAMVIENTSDFVGIATPDAKAIYLNQAAKKMVGLPQETNPSGYNIQDFHPEWAKEVVVGQGIPHAIEHNTWVGESAIIDKDGAEIPALQSILVHKNDEGKLLHMSTIIRDISAQKQAENAIKESAAFLRKSLNSLFAFVCVCTPEGILIEANHAALKAVGVEAEDVVGKPFSETHWWSYSHKEQARLQESISKVLSGEIVRYDTHILNYQGELLPIDFQITAMRDEAGTITHLIPSAIDISERQRVEKQLREAEEKANAANQTKSEFLANISHELRTPLTAILGFSDILQQRMSQNKEFQEFHEWNHATQVIRRNGRYLLELVNDILDLSKVEADQIEIRHEPMDLNRQLSETVHLMQVRADEQQIPLNVTYHSNVPKQIFSDRVRLRQILVNLLSNAIKFTERGYVELNIECFRNTSSSQQNPAPSESLRPHTEAADNPNLKTDAPLVIRLQVIDTGIGIREDIKSSLFQPFTQAMEAQRFGGTGLGLSISKRLTENMNGALTVQSLLGQGSKFSLWLPIVQPDDDNSFVEPHLETMTSHSNLPHESVNIQAHILVVDDHEDIRQVTQQMLEDSGITVSLAEHGQQALEQVQTFDQEGTPLDLILMDMHMPIMDGYQATKQMRGLGISIPIIALTAGAMKGDREKCIQVGCNDYHPKPINRSQLLSLVTSYTTKSTPPPPNKSPASTRPISAPSNKPPASTNPTSAPTNTPSPMVLLLVEDSPDLAKFFSMSLRTFGYQVHTAFNGAQAKKITETISIDAFLLDMTLPDTTGFELIVELRNIAQTESPRFFAVSGHDTESVREKAQALGFEDYFLKPVDVETIHNTLQKV